MQKIPVIPAIKHALNAVFHFRETGIRIGLPWIILLAALSTVELLFFGSADFSNDASAQDLNVRPTDFILAAVGLIALSSIAVNWHRYILLDEHTPPEKIFRLDAPVWKYAAHSILIMLIALVPVIIISFLVALATPNAIALLAFPLFMAGIYIMRMSVALPATALERNDFGIRAALQATAGNNLQFAGLLALNALIMLGTFLALAVALTIAGNISITVVKVCAVLLSIPANLFFSLFSISLLSSLYGYFAEGRKF